MSLGDFVDSDSFRANKLESDAERGCGAQCVSLLHSERTRENRSMAKKAAKKTAEKTKRPASRRTVLAIDIGGTHVKVMTDKDRIRREFESGPTLSATEMVRQVKALTRN